MLGGIYTLKKIVDLIYENTGHDFSLYKKNTLYRRIQKRMSAVKIGSITAYTRFLKENTAEIELLFNELLIGVTSFFRDAAIWERLKQDIFPSMLDGIKDGQIIRAWIPACSTGEEAYSLAIVFKEVLGEVCPGANITMQIFATDLDAAAIDRGKKGIYKESILTNVSEKRLDNFFEKTDNGYRIKDEIREMVVFARQNIVTASPFTGLDMLLCRNLLIYMERELQDRLISLFYYSIKPGGYLILGNSEAISETGGKFLQAAGGFKIYKRLGSEKNDAKAEAAKTPGDNLRMNNAMKGFLDSIGVAALFLDRELNIRHYTKQLLGLFKILESDIGRPVTDLASELLYTELPEDVREVLETLTTIEKSIQTHNDNWLNMCMMPYRTSDERIEGVVITFVAAPGFQPEEV